MGLFRKFSFFFLKIKRRMGMAYAFYRLIQDPTKTHFIFYLSQSAKNETGPLLKQTVDHIVRTPGLEELYQKNYSSRVSSLSELKLLPKNTLGHIYADHLEKNNLQMDFFPEVSGPSLENYVIRRVREDHDLWHVLTGFDTSIVGEAALQAFGLAQLRSPLSALLIVGGFLHTLAKNNSLFFSYTDQVFAGYQMGKQSKILLGVPLGDYLKHDLNEVRRMLGINAWTTNV